MFFSRIKKYNTAYKREYRLKKKMSSFSSNTMTETQVEALQQRTINLTLKEQQSKKRPTG